MMFSQLSQLALFCLLFLSLRTYSACTSPTGQAGHFLWTANDYKYCADTTWVSMAGTVGAACTSGGQLELSGNDLRFCSSNSGNWTLLKKTTSDGVCTTTGKIEYVSASSYLRWCSAGTWYKIPNGPSEILESFEQASGCMSGWTEISMGYGFCNSSTLNVNHGTYSLELQAGMDYGSGRAVYKAYDLTGYSKIEIDVTAMEWSFSGTAKACIQVYSSVPTSDVSCNSGLLYASRTNAGKLTINLTGQTGSHYIYIHGYDGYEPVNFRFDSLKLIP